MSEPFLGEIRMFAGNFAPRGWALCDGQLFAVSQNEALFSLLGTIYGGDGRTTFGLPDLRGRIPIHTGYGPGLTTRTQGQKRGSETVTLVVNELPPHSHSTAAWEPVSGGNPGGSVLGHTGDDFIYGEVYGSPTTLLNADASRHLGGSQPHSNLMPFLCVHFIIALVGIYPSRH